MTAWRAQAGKEEQDRVVHTVDTGVGQTCVQGLGK